MKARKLFLTFYALVFLFCGNIFSAEKKLTVLCSTFPIYQITRNVVGDQKGVEVQLMLPAQLGCPHDYALTPQDMQKLFKADVLVINGLGLEEFLGAPLKRANPKLNLIDSSHAIKNTIKFEDVGHADHEKKKDDDHGDHEGHKHGPHCTHEDTGVNPHLFVSPSMQIKIAKNIAEDLGKLAPKKADNFKKNTEVYAKKMEKLAKRFAQLGQKLKNNRIVQPHGVFDYLARDAGLKIIATLQSHGHQPSAAEMIKIVKTIKREKAGAIFTEPQYPAKIGKTLSKEAKIPVTMLYPTASGPNDAPLNYYETKMNENLKILSETLGEKK